MSHILSRVRSTFHRLSVSALALTMVAVAPRAFCQTSLQTVSIPFISTYAGLAAGTTPAGAVCSASLPVYSTSGTGAKYGDGCPATQASLSTPIAVATDKQGDVFISDQSHSIIRVVYNGTGSDALAAAIIAANVQNPGLVPAKGNIYTIAGGITTAPTTHYCNGAGTGAQGDDLELDGCPGAQTYETLNRGVAVDADGNVFLSNGAVYPTIRVFYVGGTKAASLIQQADSTITPQPGYVYKVAGYGGTTLKTTGNACSTGSASTFTDVYGDGCPAVLAYIGTPRGLIVDAAEDIYFADQSANVVRRIDGTASVITEVAGCVATTAACGSSTTSGDGGPAVNASVNISSPYGVALDQNGNVFIAEGGSSTLPGRIRVVFNSGTVPGVAGAVQGNIYTYAGGSGSSGTTAQMATFQLVYGVSVDPAGYLYVDDYRSGTTGSNHIWRVDPLSGNILILAGTGNSAFSSNQHCDRVKQLAVVVIDNLGDACPATQAYLNVPQGPVAFDANGNAYFADRGNNVIRKLYFNNVFPPTAVGTTSAALPQAFYFPATTTLLSKSATLQGSASTEFASTTTTNDNCPLAAALPATPDTCVSYVTFTPAAVGPRNAAYNVSDATGVVATEAVTGIGVAPALAISPSAAVTIGSGITPSAVSTDLHGNVFVSDVKNNQVLRSTIAGGATTVVLSGLGSPRQSSTDNFGTLYVADSVKNKIVKLPYGSTTSTTFGTGLNGPQGVVADSIGNVYIADTGNNRVVYYNTLVGTTTPVSTYAVTLSAPTSLALDNAGDLFIVDSNNTRVVELPVGLPAVALTLPVGTLPAGVAFDSANNAYFADGATGSILVVAAGATTATPLITGLTSPVGVAVATSGNIFVADSSAGSATGYNVAVNNSTFTTTNIPNTSLPVTLTLSDVGNSPATLATPPYTETGSAAFQASGTPTCVAGFVLMPGNSCTQTFVFMPTVAGPQTAKVVFTTTTAQSVTANLSATATNLINTSLAIAPLNATATYGQTVSYTVTLTPSSITSPAPSGFITFQVDGKAQSTQSVAGSPSTYTFSVSTFVGVHSISATYSGDAVYGASNASTLLTITKASTSTVASSSPSSAGTVLTAVVTPASAGAIALTGKVYFYIDNSLVAAVPVTPAGASFTASTVYFMADGSHTYYATYVGDANYATSTSTPVQTLVIGRATTATALSLNTTTNSSGTAGDQFTVSVTSATPGTPTGTVVITNGSTIVATLTLTPASNGTVTYFTTTTTYTSYAFVATYSGDGLYEPSASSLPQFFVITPLNIHVPQGGQISSTVTVAPVNGYTGTLAPSCSGLPTNSICRYYNTPVVIAGTTSVNFSLQIYAGVNPSVASLSRHSLVPGRREFEGGATFALLLLTPAIFGMRRRRGWKMPRLLALALVAVLGLGVAGCGVKTPAYTAGPYVTPAGTYVVTVMLTDANGIAHSNIINVAVAP